MRRNKQLRRASRTDVGRRAGWAARRHRRL